MNVESLFQETTPAIFFTPTDTESQPLIDKTKKYSPILKISIFIGLLAIVVFAFVMVNINNSRQLYKDCLVFNCTYLRLENGEYLIFNNNLVLCQAHFNQVRNFTLCYTNGYSGCPKYSFCYNRATQIILIIVNCLLVLFFLVVILVYYFIILRKK